MIITDSGIVRNTTHCFTFIVCNCTSLDIKNAQVSFLGLYAPTQQSISESTNFLFRVESASKNRPLANATMQISSDINTGDLSPTFTFSGTLKRPEDISGQTNYFPEEPNVNVAYLIAPATTSGVGIEHIIGYYLSTYAADVSNTTININTQENSDYTIKLSTANTFTQSKYSGVIIKHN